MHKLIKTEDGSHSLYVEELNEHYHSTHGALQESRHVFIEAGLKYLVNSGISQLSVLEVGFGTGLNALLTLAESYLHQYTITYTGLEAFPLDKQLLDQLNYPQLISTVDIAETTLSSFFDSIHQAPWGVLAEILPQFKLYKMKDSIQNVTFSEKFNLIYYDAFGPTAQPDMWTEIIFTKLYQSLMPQGALVTYCAKGSVKRLLKGIGFQLQTLQGPRGKREMIRVIK